MNLLLNLTSVGGIFTGFNKQVVVVYSIQCADRIHTVYSIHTVYDITGHDSMAAAASW